MREKIFSDSSILIIGVQDDAISAFAKDAEIGGARVTTAVTGLDGLSAIRATAHTVILIDEFVPEMPATDIISVLLSEHHSMQNVIVYSTDSSTKAEATFKDLGVYAYLALGVDSESRLHNSVIALIDGINTTPAVRPDGGLGTKVFVVEDSVFIRDFITSKLLDHGFTIAHADNGNIAIPKIREVMPDVILLDLELPGRHGLDILTELKTDSALEAIPVIIFSNEHDEEVHEKAINGGAVGFFYKATTDPSELIAQIKSCTET